MADQYRIDSHKLIYHPQRVSEWLKGENIYPIYVEIAPSGTCNHRCSFCAMDYMEYKPIFMDKELILNNLKEMHDKGVKSVMYAGEGEPLLNRDTPEIVNRTRELGLDVSMTTNGVFFTEEVSEKCLHSFSWIRFSVNAGTEETYRSIHRGKSGDFARVISNIQAAVQLKKKKKIQTTIGVQMLMIPENTEEVVKLGEMLKDIGIDYYTVKPFSQHPKSICKMESNFDYEKHLAIESRLKKMETMDFNIIFRSNAMKKLKLERAYKQCLGNPFWAYIDAKANVWACSAYLGDPRYCFGSIKEKGFSEVWESDERHEVLERIASMDISNCREICRLDEINGYLYELKNPNAHVNFI